MNKLLAILLVLIWPVAGQCSEVPDWLVGTWQSNEALTLQDMRKHPEIPTKSRTIFENSFFGKLVHIYRKEEGTYYFIDHKPEKLQFEKYQQFTANDRSVTFVEFSVVFGKEIENTMYKDGKCFYMLVSKWQFKEYFCPVEE